MRMHLSLSLTPESSTLLQRSVSSSWFLDLRAVRLVSVVILYKILALVANELKTLHEASLHFPLVTCGRISGLRGLVSRSWTFIAGALYLLLASWFLAHHGDVWFSASSMRSFHAFCPCRALVYGMLFYYEQRLRDSLIICHVIAIGALNQETMTFKVVIAFGFYLMSSNILILKNSKYGISEPYCHRWRLNDYSFISVWFIHIHIETKF